MGSDHLLSTTVTIPKPSRRLLAALRAAVLSVQQDPCHPERQGAELTDIAIAVKGEQLQLTCEYANTTSKSK